MDIEQGASRYWELLVFLVAAGLVVPIAHRFRINPILSFVGVGVLIGPYGLAASFPRLRGILITNDEDVRFLAELGVVFLLFAIGLELSLRRLIALRHLVFGLGGLQIVATAAAIGATALAFGNTPQAAIVLGLALALSSTAIVMQILTDRGRLGTQIGRASFAILLMQDLAVIPILFVVGGLARGSDGPLVTELIKALASAVLMVGVILVAGRLLIGPIFRLTGATRSPEIFMALAMLVIIATGMGTAAAGLSVALGAFLAGLLFSDTEYRHEIEVTIAPFKGLLLGLFFMSVGMGLNLGAVAAEPVWIPLSVLGLIAMKAAIVAVLAVAFRLPAPTAAEIGLLLSQGGEFAFVVIGAAVQMEVIGRGVADFVLLVTGVTMAIAPLLARTAEMLGQRLERRFVAHSQPGLEGKADGAPVIIAGFGRVGQMLAEMLASRGVPYLAIDRNAEVIREKRIAGAPVFYGDASRPETMRRLGVARAAAIVVTTDDHHAAEHIVSIARAEAPNILILARARDEHHAQTLLDRGADEVIPETVEAALQLGGVLLRGVGLDAGSVELILEERRRMGADLDQRGPAPVLSPGPDRRSSKQ